MENEEIKNDAPVETSVEVSEAAPEVEAIQEEAPIEAPEFEVPAPEAPIESSETASA